MQWKCLAGDTYPSTSLGRDVGVRDMGGSGGKALC